MSGEHIKQYTAEELRDMVARGETETDWARVDAMTEAELEAAIASDPDWRDVPRDWWKDAVPVSPGAKRLLSLRLDPDVVEWFRAQGPGYQTRMNAVLRAYMKARRGAGGG
ncbi:BrnA antitoxin family protein [Siccirubricoccus sp. G192]|uniref:BrnA antitoxin family protein n=1 Tax=Siccirubricoccus sp. G192 TaxID=2849651 RepID=UPI001C2BDC56|nr:BrnA antitoxin family protein [Siccirubricoccus sp. G192]MBV1797286.1 BrnA antitoxin family protein [Siccirubricoccus sp. G192]